MLFRSMAFAVISDLVAKGKLQLDEVTARHNYIKAIDKALLKVMSKMGISTIRSYRGAKIFEALGISKDLLSEYFGTSSSTIGGIGLEDVYRDAVRLHDEGFCKDDISEILPFEGQYSFRKDGIKHAWTPEAISNLQLATQLGSYKKFKEFSSIIDNRKDPLFIRDFFTFKKNPI